MFKVQKPNEATAEHIKLKAEVEKTLSALYVIFASDEMRPRLNENFAKLLNLAQAGLVGRTASTSVAFGALAQLHDEVVTIDGGKLKNTFLRRAGLLALIFSLPGALAAVTLYELPLLGANSGIYSNLGAVWASCMIGAWISFASSKLKISFYDLASLEEDQLAPSLRLAFSGLLTIALALGLLAGLFEVKIGNYDASEWASSPLSSIILGLLAGIGEKALPARITRPAEQLTR